MTGAIFVFLIPFKNTFFSSNAEPEGSFSARVALTELSMEANDETLSTRALAYSACAEEAVLAEESVGSKFSLSWFLNIIAFGVFDGCTREVCSLKRLNWSRFLCFADNN